jgi:ferric-chelate reductase
MEMGGEDDGGKSSMDMPMTCSASDSPGNLSTVGLDMTDPNIQLDFLTALLDDACLQIWSSAYSRYFWYGIAAVIGVFTLKRLVRATQLEVRRRSAVVKRSRSTSGILRLAASTFRSVSYRQYSPVRWPQLLKVPPVGTLLLITAYLIFILCLVFIRSSTGDDQTYQSIGVRSAWVTVAQLPLVVLLANKRNFVDLFTAVGYERLNVLHRWVARGLFLTATFHFGFQNEGWRRLGLMQLEWSIDACPPTGTFPQSSHFHPNLLTIYIGVAAYAILIWMNISTLPPFRAMSYEIFVAQHLVTFFGLIVAIMIHIPSTALFARTYVYIAIGFYLFCRLVQTLIYLYRNVRPGTASLTKITPAVVQVRVRGNGLSSWSPGSFVLLGIPRFGPFQSHPATIASTPTSHGGDLIFILRARSGFTQKLLSGTDNDRERVALIDGPYGGKQDDLAAYSTAVLVAGSTGISFILPILVDIAQRAALKTLPVRAVHLIWAAKERKQLEAFIIELEHTLSNLQGHGVETVLHTHVTGDIGSAAEVVHFEKRPSESSSVDQDETTGKEATAVATPRPIGARSDSGTSMESANAQIIHGRPNLNALLTTARATTLGGEEMGVAVCGPLSMSRDVRDVVAGMRGVYLHVEGFSW